MNTVGHTTLRPWGNSQGIRISKEILDIMHLSVNDELSISINDNQLILEKNVRRKTLEEPSPCFSNILTELRPLSHSKKVNFKLSVSI